MDPKQSLCFCCCFCQLALLFTLAFFRARHLAKIWYRLISKNSGTDPVIYRSVSKNSGIEPVIQSRLAITRLAITRIGYNAVGRGPRISAARGEMGATANNNAVINCHLFL